MFLILFIVFFSKISWAQNPPRVLYFCSVCDQYQMASTEDQMAQAAAKAGVGVAKFGNVSQYSEYLSYKRIHPGAEVGNMVRIKEVKLGFDFNDQPTTEKGWKERRQKFKIAKDNWMAQISDQLSKMDKTKPIVLHMGNHGLNPGDNQKPGEATFMCMFGLVAHSAGECISYEEFGKLMEKAGLTGDQAPSVRIIGDHCYGGGVHYLSTKFSNVCSASIVSHKTPQFSPGTMENDDKVRGMTGIDAFGTTFWRNVRQSGSKANLADAYNSAWGTVPMNDHPGGTLSSIFYVQQVMGLSDEALPTQNRLSAINDLERSFLVLEELYAGATYNYSKYQGIKSYEKPKFSCEMPMNSVSQQLSNLEKISQSLGLSTSANIYQQGLTKAKDINFMKTARQNKINLDSCYKTAQAAYEKSTKEAQAYMEKSRWSKEFFWKFGDSIDKKKVAFSRSKEEEMAGKILKDLESCVEKNAVGVREYLNTVSVLNRLGQLENFSKKSTPSQKAEFRKKVACESAPLF